MTKQSTPSRGRAGQPPRGPAPSRRTPILAIGGAVLAVVVVIGIAIAAAGSGGDDDDRPVFGPVTVEGTALTPLPDAGADPAEGQVAPTLTGRSPDGDRVGLGGQGEPTLVAFLAHWCPHCQAELPVLVDLADDGAFEGIRTVAVLTGTNPDAPNFPPASWLDREGWDGDVLLDNDAQAAARAYGLTSYPLLVALDADGNVVGRMSGEQPAAVVTALADAARGSD
ncbi:MAG: TlpA family protein disulfide reductase [Acidimicrobiia bacterium]